MHNYKECKKIKYWHIGIIWQNYEINERSISFFSESLSVADAFGRIYREVVCGDLASGSTSHRNLPACCSQKPAVFH